MKKLIAIAFATLVSVNCKGILPASTVSEFNGEDCNTLSAKAAEIKANEIPNLEQAFEQAYKTYKEVAGTAEAQPSSTSTEIAQGTNPETSPAADPTATTETPNPEISTELAIDSGTQEPALEEVALALQNTIERPSALVMDQYGPYGDGTVKERADCSTFPVSSSVYSQCDGLFARLLALKEAIDLYNDPEKKCNDPKQHSEVTPINDGECGNDTCVFGVGQCGQCEFSIVSGTPAAVQSTHTLTCGTEQSAEYGAKAFCSGGGRSCRINSCRSGKGEDFIGAARGFTTGGSAEDASSVDLSANLAIYGRFTFRVAMIKTDQKVEVKGTAQGSLMMTAKNDSTTPTMPDGTYKGDTMVTCALTVSRIGGIEVESDSGIDTEKFTFIGPGIGAGVKVGGSFALSRTFTRTTTFNGGGMSHETAALNCNKHTTVWILQDLAGTFSDFQGMMRQASASQIEAARNKAEAEGVDFAKQAYATADTTVNHPYCAQQTYRGRTTWDISDKAREVCDAEATRRAPTLKVAGFAAACYNELAYQCKNDVF